MIKTASMLGQLQSKVDTGAVSDARMAPNDNRRSGDARPTWERIFDLILDWSRSPGYIDADGLTSPSHAALVSAAKIVTRMKRANYSPPMRIVGDGDGGVVLESEGVAVTAAYRIDAEGAAEYLSFEDCRLKHRESMNLAD